MSVIIIDDFTFQNNDDVFTGVSVYFNNATGAVTDEVYAGYLTSGTVTIGQRGRANGSAVASVISEDGTISYNLVSDNTQPFALIGSESPVVPEPPHCDLSLSVVATNETAQGANNGTATLSATTTFTPVQYSINGINFSSTTVYSNLSPGNYVAYSKDANGCTSNIPFTIEPFSNPIDGGFTGGLPQVTVSPGNISRWNAAYNPIVLNFFTTPDPAKSNFRIEIEITSESGVVTGSWSPNTAGLTRCDISAYLQSLVNANDDFKYDVLNWRDINRAASFTIRYREVWDEDSSVWYYAPQPLYVTYSAKQLGDKYGGNMAEYVPFLNEPNPLLKAKFLTLFDEPTAWVGLPFDNSFIFSEYIIGHEVKVRTQSLDINRQPVSGGIVNSFLLNNDAGYILGSELGRLIIQTGALPPVSNDGILEQLGINRLMLAGNPADGVEYFKIQLYTGTDEAPNFITQPLTIKINKQCNDPYVYIKWLNTLGGWDYWRFGHDQIKSISTSDEINVDRNVFDWENDDTIADIIKKNAIEKISFGATVPTIKLKGLKGMHESIKIQVLVNTNPYKWQTVTLSTGSFETKRTKNEFSELKFTLNYPERNIQRQ